MSRDFLEKEAGEPLCKNGADQLGRNTVFCLIPVEEWAALGCIYRLDASRAQRNFEPHLRILQHPLRQLHLLPKPDFEKVEDLQQYLELENHILIDATGIPIQRPANQVQQKKAYSGKKKPTV